MSSQNQKEKFLIWMAETETGDVGIQRPLCHYLGVQGDNGGALSWYKMCSGIPPCGPTVIPQPCLTAAESNCPEWTWHLMARDKVLISV